MKTVLLGIASLLPHDVHIFSLIIVDSSHLRGSTKVSIYIMIVLQKSPYKQKLERNAKAMEVHAQVEHLKSGCQNPFVSCGNREPESM
jgi:hypothetical protein